MKRVIHCYYNTNDPLVTQLGDLKIEYSDTESHLIKSLLNQTEQLLIFRVGSAEDIRKRMKDVVPVKLTLEEICFFDKLKKLLKGKK